jgi:CheY-like chemotaxis protein
MRPPKIHAHPGEEKRRLPLSISQRPDPGFTTRILIVDPDRQVGVTLSFMLAMRRYEEVRSVRSARRALAVAEHFPPDLVFLDFDLPDDGGIPLARQLTRDAHRRQPRFIGLTKHAMGSDDDKTRAGGFERLLVKPVSQEDLDRILTVGKAAA